MAGEIQHLTRDMMAGEIQEPFNLSLLENSIHSGSVSFGRFEKEAISWEKRSSFSHNRYLEEAEKLSKPGSVTQMRAHFEAHFKKKGIRFPSSIEAQTWGGGGGEVVQHHQVLLKHSQEQDKYDDQEISQLFGDSCVSYDDNILVNDGDHISLYVALENTDIGGNEMTLEDKEETTPSSAATRSKSLKMVKKAIPLSAVTKVSTKKHVVITKGSSSCKGPFGFGGREKELKSERIVKTIAAQAPTSKKTESLTPLATNKYRSKNCTDPATREKREEKLEVVVPKTLFRARPIPKFTQARPQQTSRGQAKARDDAQEQSSKACCDRSMANGTVKSKFNVNKQRYDLNKSLNGIRPKSSDQSARNNANRTSLAFRQSLLLFFRFNFSCS